MIEPIPTDLLVSENWRVHPDPEIPGGYILVHDLPGEPTIVGIALVEQGVNGWSAFTLPADMEYTLGSEVDAECIYPLYPRDGEVSTSLDQVIEYVGSLL